VPIDPASDIPLYRQLVEQIRNLIASGAVRPGERIPPVRELAEATRVNRNTAARAVQQLESLGLVRARVGQGTFVRRPREVIDRAAVSCAIEGKLDRLIVEAHLLGAPLEELGWQLARRIERFKLGRGAGAD